MASKVAPYDKKLSDGTAISFVSDISGILDGWASELSMRSDYQAANLAFFMMGVSRKLKDCSSHLSDLISDFLV